MTATDPPSATCPSTTAASASIAGAAASRSLLPPGPDPGLAVPLPLLADPAGYRACEHDLLRDPAGRAYWLELFAGHIAVQLEHAVAAGLIDEATSGATAAEMRAAMDRVAADPGRHGRLDILVLDSIRRRVLADAGVHDEFAVLKRRENARAMDALPAWLADLDAMDAEPRAESIIAGLLAGNLFDMGARETAARFAGDPPEFRDLVAKLPPPPWRCDDRAAAAGHLQSPPRRTLILVDNAGADVVLGALPLARGFVRAGGAVTLAANRAPALNDVTASELRGLLADAAAIDPAFGDGSIRVVDSGSASPLIDLAGVSAELAEAAADPEVGLLVLLGMGRAVESNWTARFTVPCLRVAMLKDPQVAARLGTRVPDAVVRHDAAG